MNASIVNEKSAVLHFELKQSAHSYKEDKHLFTDVNSFAAIAVIRSKEPSVFVLYRSITTKTARIAVVIRRAFKTRSSELL